MKTLNIKTPLIALLLIITTAFVASAQDSRIQMGSLDHLAAKASQTVDVSIDERLIRVTEKLFSNTKPDEKEIKKVLVGLKGIYVKSFEFETEGQFTAADVESIRYTASWSGMVANGRRQEQKGRKFRSPSADDRRNDWRSCSRSHRSERAYCS